MCIQLYINLRGYDAPITPHVRPSRVTSYPQPLPHDDNGPGRKASISREDLMAAALKLVGPHRSVSTLSLREVAREAGSAPHRFYRQFRDMDELAVALIDLAGRSLRKIIGEARHRAYSSDRSVVRGSVEAFIEQLRADDKLLHVLLREGNVGSDAFKHAVELELQFFEEELCMDLVRLATRDNAPLYEPALVSKAITRLVFAMGATAMDLPPEKDQELIEQLSEMVRMIITGSRALASRGGGQR
jgi:AcrR family transcriptional regulator